jgi:hypothetical protein
MLLKPRRLACAAPAELDTDAIRNRDSGMFDSVDLWQNIECWYANDLG